MGKNGEILRFQKAYHKHSITVESYDFNLTPQCLRALHGVDDEAFKTYISLPYVRDDQGKILVNEALPDWELLRDLLLSLDRLPDSLLVDIYRMDSKRFKDDLMGNSTEEMLRKAIYQLIPEIIWAHGFQKE